ncbi:putative inner membrane protein [Escherichia coli]|uniref:Putative inner membrane protein n=1 Tax=Escherichia coli TaxID=562 RepID=A0A377BN23_ECOLX|nr:putative inner membrane protein [Escherichia coli]
MPRAAGGTGYPRGGAGCGGDGVSTGSAWRYRPRRIRRTLCNVANGVNDPLLLVQLGPLPVLIPAIIWLYWTGDTTWGTVLLVWSGVVGTLDNVIRPMLIRMGADLPLILILSGVIGGLIAFGMIGLFIGPVLLAVSWRLFAAWVEEVPPPTDQPEEIPRRTWRNRETE